MLEDLDHLADRVEQLVKFANDARADNAVIIQRLAHSEAENRRLRALLVNARDRVDHVLARIPDPDAARTEEHSANGTA